MIISYARNATGASVFQEAGMHLCLPHRIRYQQSMVGQRRRLRTILRGSNPTPDVLMNWGCGAILTALALPEIFTRYPEYRNVALLNPDIRAALSKRYAFRVFQEHDIPTVPVLTVEQATEVVQAGGYVLNRVDSLSGGAGITVWQPGQAVRHFLVQYVPIRHEVRVHVARRSAIEPYEIIARQYKRRQNVVPLDGHAILLGNHTRGAYFVGVQSFTAIGDRTAQRIEELAINAMRAARMDFGAVDIGVVEESRRPIVFEINSAPALESQSLVDAYTAYFIRR